MRERQRYQYNDVGMEKLHWDKRKVLVHMRGRSFYVRIGIKTLSLRHEGETLIQGKDVGMKTSGMKDINMKQY